MQAEGWRLRLAPGHTTFTVRFRHKGKRVERSTGKSDRKEAAREAAQIYAETVAARTAARPISAELDKTVASFLADYEMAHARGTFETVTCTFARTSFRSSDRSQRLPRRRMRTTYANCGAPLAGVAHLVGHKHISTTALYVQTGEVAARAALAARGSIRTQRAAKL